MLRLRVAELELDDVDEPFVRLRPAEFTVARLDDELREVELLTVPRLAEEPREGVPVTALLPALPLPEVALPLPTELFCAAAAFD